MKRIAYLFVLCLVVTSPVLAEEKAKTGADPTDFITRVEPSYEHKFIHHDNSDDVTNVDVMSVRTDLALRRDLNFRFDVTVAHFNPGDVLETAGFDSKFGLSDIVTQLNYKPYSSEKGAIITGMRVDWPSNTSGELGAGGFTYAPIAIFAWFPRKDLIIGPTFQYFIGNNHDNDPLPGSHDRNEMSYRQLVLWQPMKKHVSWLLLDPDLKINFENNNEVKFNLGVEYGKVLSRRSALFAKPNIEFGQGDVSWGVKVGFRYMFPEKLFFEKASKK